ncbi:MAG: type II secretion system protein GspD [Chlamydiales bacterium]
MRLKILEHFLISIFLLAFPLHAKKTLSHGDDICGSVEGFGSIYPSGSICPPENPCSNQASSLEIDFEGEASDQQPIIEEPRLSAPRRRESLTEQAELIPHYQNIVQSPECPLIDEEGYTINFEDISIIQLIHFISKISGTNYIFNSEELQFNVSIVSEDATSVEELFAALLQVLKINNFSVIEEGNNVIIYRNNNVSKVATVITDENVNESCDQAVVTRVFRLYNLNPLKILDIVQPLLSPDAVVDVSEETRHLIVTDITANVNRIGDLVTALDTPNAIFDVAEYRVKSAYPDALVAYANEILLPMTQDSHFRLISQPSANKIFIVANPYFIHKALQILESLDTSEITEVVDLPATSMANNHFHMYKLKYQDGRLIADAMKEIGNNLQYAGVANLDFVNTIFSIQWLEVNNSIIITGTQDAIDKVIGLLESLDVLPSEVYIEVLIIDTTLVNSLDFGVQWIALGDEQNKLAYASGLLNNTSPVLEGTATSNPGARYVAANPAANPPAIPNPGRDVALPIPADLAGDANFINSTAAFGLGIIGNIIRHNGQSFLTLGALISALDEEADTTIVLNPRIMVENNQPASFFVGQNIPYQTTSTVIQQTGSVTQNIQYEDIGVQLDVTPTISSDGMVTLQISQEVEELVTAVGNLTPTTNRTYACTRVHVPDGTFLVMSGQVRDEWDYIHSGIPCLGCLPLIGPAFSRTIEFRKKRNLIMFVRPKVVNTIQQGIRLTNQEGYNYNWESNPCSLLDCGTERAPECETYPPPPCPDH